MKIPITKREKNDIHIKKLNNYYFKKLKKKMMTYLCLEKEPVTVRVAGDAYLGYDLAQIGEKTHHPHIAVQSLL